MAGMTDPNVKCWRCRRSWSECMGSCEKKVYTPQTTGDRHNDIAMLEQLVGRITVEIRELEVTRNDLEIQILRLKNPPVEVIIPKPRWVKVHQLVPCWRCKRETEWRNPNSSPEHLNGQCPNFRGGMTAALGKSLEQIAGNTFNPDEFLPK